MTIPTPVSIEVLSASDGSAAHRAAKAFAVELGFAEKVSEEIALVVSELASNLNRHARGGTLKFSAIQEAARSGLEIETIDLGPGIADVEKAMSDGFSTAGSLGYGLGTVNRLMDELDIASRQGPGHGTRVVCRRWLRQVSPHRVAPCPLAFGVASRAHPHEKENGDAFVCVHWDASLLVAVIDGLGHGPLAHQAAQAARSFVERHFDQPLPEILRGVARTCGSTRGVVMSLARFDWARSRMTFAGIGNIEVRIIGSPEPVKFIIPRGVLGTGLLEPKVTEHHWEPQYLMVLHSDGVGTRWHWKDFDFLANKSPTYIAQHLLRRLAKDADDATVAVIRDAIP